MGEGTGRSALWVAVLGLAFYALVLGARSIDGVADIGGEPRRVTGWFLIGAGTLFAFLWLSQIIQALADGTVPAAVSDLGVPTNAVHVLDLAVFLPTVIAAGTQVLRRRPPGAVMAPVLLLFLAFTGLPILLTPPVAAWLDHPAGWAVLAPIALITAASLALFAGTTRQPRHPATPAPPRSLASHT